MPAVFVTSVSDVRRIHYVMEGRCYNCRETAVVIVYRFGDHAGDVDCPTCGGRRAVHAEKRLPNSSFVNINSKGER